MSQQPASGQAKTGSTQPQPPKPKAPFDIDNYLNPYIPRNPLYLLPTWMSFWFGYREPGKTPPFVPRRRLPLRSLRLYASILIGAFCGVAIIENVSLALPSLSGHTVPIVIGSFGAAAILEYNTIESPLAQPRNLVLGHFFSAIVGVGITKLFLHLPPERFNDLEWLAGALAVGVASVVMSVTKTVHPPAGATALLAATNLEVRQLGWWLLPLVLLSAMLMLASALLLNNFAGRKFPVYWWTPVDLKALREERRKARRDKKQGGAGGDVEKAETDSTMTTTSSSEDEGEVDGENANARGDQEETISSVATETGDDLRRESTRATRLSRTLTYSSASRMPRATSRAAATAARSRSRRSSMEVKMVRRNEGEEIIITKNEFLVPEWLELNDWEDEVVRILMRRLNDH